MKYISYQLSEHRSVRNSTNLQYTINLLFAIRWRKLSLNEFRKYVSIKLIFIFHQIGSFNGTLSKTLASDLGAIVLKEVLSRANTNAADVSEVILGQVNIIKL